MEKNSNIETVMNSLEGIKRAGPSPFFTGRVLSQMQEPVLDRSFVPRVGPVWALVVLFLLLVCNLFIFFSKNDTIDQLISDWKSSTPAWVVDYTEDPGASIYDLPNK